MNGKQCVEIQERHRTMTRKSLIPFTAILLVALTSHIAFAQRIITEMTPALIAEAIKAGEEGNISDGKINKRYGWNATKAHLATFSTPFMRVAWAAGEAKKEYRKFTAADVTPEMIAPELHIYGWSQIDGARTSNVTAMVVTPKKGKEEEKRSKAKHPLRFEPIPTIYKYIYGGVFEANGRLGIFPLSVLSEENEIHIIYDNRVKITFDTVRSAYCEDCNAEFKLDKVR
jgi:hypothetical protein